MDRLAALEVFVESVDRGSPAAAGNAPVIEHPREGFGGERPVRDGARSRRAGTDVAIGVVPERPCG